MLRDLAGVRPYKGAAPVSSRASPFTPKRRHVTKVRPCVAELQSSVQHGSSTPGEPENHVRCARLGPARQFPVNPSTMAAVRAEAPEQRRVDRLVTVFDGSAPEDVSHARRLWSSVSLLPPLEARLVAADVRQRLPTTSCTRLRAELQLQDESVHGSLLQTVTLRNEKWSLGGYSNSKCPVEKTQP
ncbi:hypothetical protein F2P81_015503 [Scophthalmus maximus]|uniref:Cilia- and flagella-associated protein HOATZ n=1 Tax=Scophthalmus maximus TaxID=52904 RepID=A0A6A4SGF2_SCOMX|nr:hypothetical protein F2P81_015503 [Scophthalmus maximus]